MAIYQMVIQAQDPDRYVPASWNFECASADPADVWDKAMKIATEDSVNVVRILDEYGREVWE